MVAIARTTCKMVNFTIARKMSKRI